MTLSVILGSTTALAQDAAPPDGAAALRVFLDCGDECDLDHLRTEITFVNYVRDRRDAQVHVLVTTESSGGGGRAHTIDYIGLREFAGVDDRLVYYTTPDATFASPFDIGLPILGWAILILGWARGLPSFMGWLMLGLLLASCFVWDFFGRGYRMLRKYDPKQNTSWRTRRIHELKFMLAMPWIIILQARPRLTAFWKYVFGAGNYAWVKTERTPERPAERALPILPGTQRAPESETVLRSAADQAAEQPLETTPGHNERQALVLKCLAFGLCCFSLVSACHTTAENKGQVAPGGLTNLAAGRPYSLASEPSQLYPDPGGLLTDGVPGPRENLERHSKSYMDGWVGFEHGTPMITLDLGHSYPIHNIVVSFLAIRRIGAQPPQAIRVLTSFNGTRWIHRGSMRLAHDSAFELNPAGWSARYVRLLIKRRFWVFLDEIQILGVPSGDPSQWEPIKRTLIVTSDFAVGDERRLRLSNLLDGMGFPFDVAEANELDAIEFLDYQLLIFAGSSKILLTLTEGQEQRIISAINSGTHVLWIGGGIWGSFKTADLAEAFGLHYVKRDSNEAFGVRYAEFTNLAQNTERLPVQHETLWIVTPEGASVEGWYLDEYGNQLDIPFITRFRAEPHRGTAVYIALPLLDRWKTTETPDTYARAEILLKTIRSLVDSGIVAKHSVAYAKDAAFMIRLEDYSPGGSATGHTTRASLIRMERLLELTHAHNLPLNIGIIPRFNHPFIGESHMWTDESPTIVRLRRMAELAFQRGGNLIVHGFDHQHGTDVDDVSGTDWETWDEDTEAFLSFDEQKQITDGAFAEIRRVWGITPTIWETPHYLGNDDTYRAAHSTGFLYLTESDTKLFPNRNGYLNRVNGLMLNLPETGSFFPLDAAETKEKTLIKQRHILPRLVRLGAPFLFFYHNLTSPMHRALENFLFTATRYDLWKPNMEDYAKFWERRERVNITPAIDREARRIKVEVADPFDGFTLAIQLPMGKTLSEVTIDGAAVDDAKTRQSDGGLIVYAVLKDETRHVDVTYQ